MSDKGQPINFGTEGKLDAAVSVDKNGDVWMGSEKIANLRKLAVALNVIVDSVEAMQQQYEGG